MKNLIALLFLACSLSACAPKGGDGPCYQPQEQPADDGRPAILVLGDSISIGWTLSLQSSGALSAYQIVHGACNGQTSTYTLDHLHEWLSSRGTEYRWAAIVINNGMWDIGPSNTGSVRYSQQEVQILNRAKVYTDNVLFVLTTGVPVNAEGRVDAGSVQINEIMKVEAVRNDVPYVDLYSVSHGAASTEFLDPIGHTDVHFTAQGYSILGGAILHGLDINFGIH